MARISSKEREILERYLTGGRIKEGENMFLVNELVEEGLLKKGFNVKGWYVTLRTTEFGKQILGIQEKS